MGNFKMAFEELLVIVLFGCAQEQRAGSKRGDNKHRNYEDSTKNAVNEMQWQTSLHASLAMSQRLLQGWQVDRAQKHNIFVKVSSRCV